MTKNVARNILNEFGTKIFRFGQSKIPRHVIGWVGGYDLVCMKSSLRLRTWNTGAKLVSNSVKPHGGGSHFFQNVLIIVTIRPHPTHKMSLPNSLPTHYRNYMLPLHLETWYFVQSWNFAQSLSYDHQGHLPSPEGSPTNPGMVKNQRKDGHPNKEFITDM